MKETLTGLRAVDGQKKHTARQSKLYKNAEWQLLHKDGDLKAVFNFVVISGLQIHFVLQ